MGLYDQLWTFYSAIHIYGPCSQEPVKTFTRFKDTAYCGRFRSDGQLLVAGCEDSVVRLFDVSGKVALRMFKGHTKNVVDTRFAPILVTAAEMILDIYKSVIGQSALIDRQLLRLQNLLETEINLERELLEVLGMLDTMFATSIARKEVPYSDIGRYNGLAQGEASSSRPELQVT
ncbi:hypothetical protein GOODEAATRI_007164 [Goodea atripinnis]|uniref:U3 small nucleolar RNA-associated protein 15 homolog n=1 Tax=Goodea atripinnis TaxID=208336 RepID=A0ABV0PC48_9TELE